jgi:diguanylate cyclase (GGDEF)-like protein
MADDRIVWDGATDVFLMHGDAERFRRGDAMRLWMGEAGCAKLAMLLGEESQKDTAFELDFEVASAMGNACFEMRGVRMPGPHGKAERLSGVLRIVTEKVREAQRLTYLATRDELTGHLNRTSLRTELSNVFEKAKSEQRTFAYLVASIDRLATINEAYGFGAADEVIVEVGERLAGTLRETDIIGRSAGNKLGIILGSCKEREIALVAERLRAAVRNDVITTRGGTVAATISVGAIWLPSSAASSQEAMLRAEEALDNARANGRDGFSVYVKSRQRETARLRLMGIADEVVAALNDNRLVFAYQPIVCARTREVKHHECLLRMIKPDGTVVSAGHFITAAEQLGLIRLVDRHALEMTIAKLHANPKASLAVNVSGTTTGDHAWLKSFVSYVRANHQVASRLTVELTETAALNDFEEIARFVSTLRDMGCRVAIDDFGAGFTSFRNLQMLKVDMVKIDGSYIKGLVTSPENQIFVRTLVDLAKNFDLKTVAEWVGSDEEAALLESFGVDYFQGFHLGEPVLAPEWAKD